MASHRSSTPWYRPTGPVLAGSLEPRALEFVQEWAALRHKEILANWERARDSQPMFAIPPLP